MLLMMMLMLMLVDVSSIGSSLSQVTTVRDDNITRLLNVNAFTPRQYTPQQQLYSLYFVLCTLCLSLYSLRVARLWGE